MPGKPAPLVSAPVTVRETLAEGAALLAQGGIDTPGLDASLLLAHILHTRREGLIIRGPDFIAHKDREQFRLLLERRLQGECVAYILGRKEFRGLEFTVTPDVLVPRPDTETLVEAVLEEIKEIEETRKAGSGKQNQRLEVLDLCTGSGAVAIALKHEQPDLEITASDISGKALAVAAENCVKLLGSMSIRFIASDLFEKLTPDPENPGNDANRFDIILSNPPYIPSLKIDSLAPEVRREPRLALDGGSDGMDLIRLIAAQGKERLKPSGSLFLEADPGQMKTIAAILKDSGFTLIKTFPDLGGMERVIKAESPLLNPL
ncbi:MAG: peptide chain release factor N(5)-glutamine methyltransferase [Treponema sp.]|jgi:release factor glutamine methyltransferase|nr:peptide chain release factor N(5)-glutamine methyltransferase [Treponema sp.]